MSIQNPNVLRPIYQINNWFSFFLNTKINKQKMVKNWAFQNQTKTDEVLV